MRVAVIGLGKIGLPLAVQYASKGHSVLGVDINPRLVEIVNAGDVPFPGEADLDWMLRDAVTSDDLVATTDYGQAVSQADAVVVVVPLFVDETTAEPDFGWMDSATRDLAATLTPGTLISYETTLPVGTTRGRWVPMLEAGSGLQEGTDFHVVFSPERVFTGRVFADLRKYPKLIGGLSPAGSDRARQFYEAVLDFDDRPDLARPNGVWDLGSAEAAEMAKLAETTYRDVNIALANQFALYAERAGIDIHQVIEASNSQPFSHIHQPGIAVGGHCIPVYPRLYLFNDPAATVVRAAREANAGMPAAVVARLSAELGGLEGLRVAVLGASYRGGVKETAFSGVFATVEELTRAGASPLVHDPLYTDDELAALGFSPNHLGNPVDAAVIQADHREYADLTSADLPGVKAIADGRNHLRVEAFHGVRLLRLGDGQSRNHTGGASLGA